MKKIMTGTLIVLLACLGAATYYFGVHTKTPEYAIKEIREAAAKHDTVGFQKRVNLDRALTRGTDDIIAFMLGESSSPMMETSFARDLVSAIKPAIASGLKETILTMVRTGTFEGNDATPRRENGMKDMSADAIIEKSGARSIALKDIAYIKKNDEGSMANVGLKIEEPDLGDYILDVEMERQSDRTWQVVAVTNLREYLEALAAAKKAALKEYLASTQPIIDQFDAELKSIRSAAKIASPELVTKMIDNREKLAVALSGVSVPTAAQEIAEMRQEYISSIVDYLSGMKESLSGNDNLDIMRAAREANQRASVINEELEKLEKALSK